METTYRTVRIDDQMTPFDGGLNLPTYLTTFRQGEFRFPDDVGAVLVNGAEVSFGAFVNDSLNPEGLPLSSYEASHGGTQIAALDDISSKGFYYLPVEGDQEIDGERIQQFSQLCSDWDSTQATTGGTAEARRLQVTAMYMCYSFTKSHLPEDFVLVADGDDRDHSRGHHSLCVRADVFVPGTLRSLHRHRAVYSAALLACGGWRPHCFRLKAAAYPRPFTDGFDRDVWRTCRLIVLYAGACFDEKHCDTLLTLADQLDQCSYQLLVDALGRDLCMASLEALEVLREAALEEHEYDTITRTMDRLHDLLSLAQSSGSDSGDVEVYAGGKWGSEDVVEEVAINMEKVLRIFSDFANMPTAFTAYVQAHGVLPTNLDGFHQETYLRSNLVQIRDLLSRESSKMGTCRAGSFATKIHQLSASGALSLGELLRSDPLLANYFNACVICATDCRVTNSTVVAVEAVLASKVTYPTVEQAACHTYCTLFRVSKDLTDSEAAKVCSSLADGIKYLQRNVWGLEGQRIMVMALGGQHKVNLPRIYSDYPSTPREWIETMMAALTTSKLLRHVCTHQHGTLSLVPSAEQKFIVCFSFYESPLLQHQMQKMVVHSLHLMSVPIYATDDVCIAPVI